MPSIAISKLRKDSICQRLLIAGIVCISEGCATRRLLLLDGELLPILGGTIAETRFSTGVSLCPKTMVVSRVVVGGDGSVPLGCSSLLKTLRVFSNDRITTERKQTSAEQPFLSPNGRVLQGTLCSYVAGQCRFIRLCCVLVKSMPEVGRNRRGKNELCNDSFGCSPELTCDANVCRSPSELELFSSIVSRPNNMLQSPERKTSATNSMSNGLFIVGIQCPLANCRAYHRLVLYGN